MKRLVILGSSGFVGRRLREHFSGHALSWDVVGLGSRDINLTDAGQSLRLSEYFDPSTTVIMCSGIKSNYGSNVENYLRNVAMAANVCRALEKSPVRRLIFFSSIAVYGVDKHNTSITEQTQPAPDTHYGLSKFDSEMLLSMQFGRTAASSLVLLRMPTMYGPNEKIIASTPSGFLTTYTQGGEVTLFGDGSERREFLFIDDVVRITEHLVNSTYSGVLNVGTGRPVSYRDVLDTISRLLHKPLTIHYRDRTKQKVDKIYGTALLRKLIPGFASTPSEDALRCILERIRATPSQP